MNIDRIDTRVSRRYRGKRGRLNEREGKLMERSD